MNQLLRCDKTILSDEIISDLLDFEARVRSQLYANNIMAPIFAKSYSIHPPPKGQLNLTLSNPTLPNGGVRAWKLPNSFVFSNNVTLSEFNEARHFLRSDYYEIIYLQDSLHDDNWATRFNLSVCVGNIATIHGYGYASEDAWWALKYAQIRIHPAICSRMWVFGAHDAYFRFQNPEN